MTLARCVPSLPEMTRLEAPSHIDPASLSVVVAVRDNAEGVRQMLASAKLLLHTIREVVVVDDGSITPLDAGAVASWSSAPLQLVRCSGIGAGAARNHGVRVTTGSWLWFIDSDCTLTPNALREFQQAADGAVAYAGGIRASGRSIVSRYYDVQEILVPFGTHDDGTVQHVVTANAVVWKPAFEAIGGFDARFYVSAGEDVDLGLRLCQVGRIKYVPSATMRHDFGGALAFVRRFYRYGRANAILGGKYTSDFSPQRQRIDSFNPLLHALALIQYGASMAGYLTERHR